MDALDKSYQHIQLSPATCLQLPLSSIHRFDNPLPGHAAAGPNTPNGPSSPIARLSLRSWSKIQVSDVFFFDSHRGCLRKKRHTDIDPFPFLISRFFKALEKNDIWLEPFFLRNYVIPHNSTLSIPMGMIDFAPFVDGLEPPDLFSVKMSTARLQSVLLPLYSLPVFSPTISRRQWNMFWKEDIPLKARDVWYRLLHNKLPCRSALHRTLPSFFVDSVCQICSTIAESSTHFVCSCHHKHPIWEYIWDTYIDTPFSQPALYSAIFSLNMPTVKSIYKNTSSFQFLACTLLAIWSSHWSFIFAGSRFALPEVITLIQKHLDKLNPDLID